MKVSGSQKTVFMMLVAVLLLEFGSLTKLQKIWGMAFNVPETTGPVVSRPGGPPLLNTITPSHPNTPGKMNLL